MEELRKEIVELMSKGFTGTQALWFIMMQDKYLETGPYYPKMVSQSEEE